MSKLLTLLLMSVVVFRLSMPIFAQEGSSNTEVKEAPPQEKAGSGRWEGVVSGTDKNQSTLTVRRRDGFERSVHYDSSTQWTSQEHHSTKVNTIDANQVKTDDRVICVGFYDGKGQFHAAMISKRLSK